MVTKAQILSIDYSGNTCTVRIPLFESAAGGDKAISTAIFSSTPGSYNGYKENDIVVVAFDDGQMNEPCVIGKLYLGAGKEKEFPRGTINCDELTAKNITSIPINTEIAYEQPTEKVKVADGTNQYKTLKLALNAIANNTAAITQLKDGTGATCTAGPGTVLCVSPVSNLYEYAEPGFSISDIMEPGTEKYPNGYYYILYNGSETLNETLAKKYMLYMTGKEVLPQEYNTKIYSGAFMTIDRKIYFPVWDSTANHLKLVIINNESLEDMIKRIIEEYSSAITTTDLTTTTTTTNNYAGGQVNDATDTQQTEQSSLVVEFEDTTI